MTVKNTLILAALGLSTLATAQTQTFNVGTSGVAEKQLASIESVTQVETMVGKTTKVSGSIKFDAKTKKGSGTIVVDLASIDTGIALRNEHMRSPQWLDTAKFPTATFATTAVKSLGGDRYEVKGNFTIHGVTKPVTTVATVRHAKASAATKEAGFAGDALFVEATFKIKLADHKIEISAPARGKISEEVTISIKALASTK